MVKEVLGIRNHWKQGGVGTYGSMFSLSCSALAPDLALLELQGWSLPFISGQTAGLQDWKCQGSKNWTCGL